MPDRLSRVVWLNGKLTTLEDATVSVGDFGFLYGEGLFETMRAERGRIAYLDRHLARLKRSGDALKLPIPCEAELRRGLADILNVPGDAPRRVRLTVTGGCADSMEAPGDTEPTVLIVARPATRGPHRLSAMWATRRRNEQDPLCGFKTISYLSNLMEKRRAWTYGADEALFLNTAGQIAEGSVSNFFLWQEGLLRTPPLNAGILPGVMRSVVVERAGEAGIPIQEMPLSPNDLYFSDAVLLTNAIMGVALLISLERQPVGTLHRDGIAARLQELIWRPDDFQSP